MTEPLPELLLKRIHGARVYASNQYSRYMAAVGITRILYGPSSPQMDSLSELRKALGEPTMAFSGPSDDVRRQKEAAKNEHLRRFEDMFLGFLEAMEADIKGGLIGSLESRYQGEVFADFVTAAKHALDEGRKDPAAVLVCAALEDSLKRYAEMNGISVGGLGMQEVINTLKGKGLISGPQKGIVDAFPKLRNAAMHADWNKIQPEDVRGAIGFIEQFLLTRFAAIALPSP